MEMKESMKETKTKFQPPSWSATSSPQTELLFLELADQTETLGIGVIFDAMLGMFGLVGRQGSSGMPFKAFLDHWRALLGMGGGRAGGWFPSRG